MPQLNSSFGDTPSDVLQSCFTVILSANTKHKDTSESPVSYLVINPQKSLREKSEINTCFHASMYIYSVSLKLVLESIRGYSVP